MRKIQMASFFDTGCLAKKVTWCTPIFKLASNLVPQEGSDRTYLNQSRSVDGWSNVINASSLPGGNSAITSFGHSNRGLPYPWDNDGHFNSDQAQAWDDWVQLGFNSKETNYEKNQYRWFYWDASINSLTHSPCFGPSQVPSLRQVSSYSPWSWYPRGHLRKHFVPTRLVVAFESLCQGLDAVMCEHIK